MDIYISKARNCDGRVVEKVKEILLEYEHVNITHRLVDADIVIVIPHCLPQSFKNKATIGRGQLQEIDNAENNGQVIYILLSVDDLEKNLNLVNCNDVSLNLNWVNYAVIEYDLDKVTNLNDIGYDKKNIDEQLISNDTIEDIDEHQTYLKINSSKVMLATYARLIQ